MIIVTAAGGALLGLVFAFVRLFAGPTLHDRVLGANVLVLSLVLLCASLAVQAGAADWLDMCFALIAGAYVTNVAILKYFRAPTFQAPLVRAEDAP